jgi:hypothetical protein
MRSLIYTLLLVAGLSNPGLGQSLLAVDGLSGDFYSISLHSGDYSLLASASLLQRDWPAMAQDSLGNILVVGTLWNQLSYSDLFAVNPSNGQLTLIATTDQVGISSIAFGPGDTLFATVDIDFPSNPHRYELYEIDLISGLSTRIGPTIDGILAMDFDGTNMYLWSGFEGLFTVDLNTGIATDVNPGFLGSVDLSKSMCFSDDGVLYALDFAFWLMEPTTGVSNFVDYSFPGILGGVEYIPGPSQTLAIWQTEQVGNATQLRIRGATPSGQVAILAADDSLGSFLIPPRFQCAGTLIDMNSATTRLVTTATANAQGEINLGPFVLPMRARGHLRLQAIDLQTCITSNRIETVF